MLEKELVKIVAIALKVAPYCVDCFDLAYDVAYIYNTHSQAQLSLRQVGLFLSWAVVTDVGSVVFDAARTLDPFPMQTVLAI